MPRLGLNLAPQNRRSKAAAHSIFFPIHLFFCGGLLDTETEPNLSTYNMTLLLTRSSFCMVWIHSIASHLQARNRQELGANFLLDFFSPLCFTSTCGWCVRVFEVFTSRPFEFLNIVYELWGRGPVQCVKYLANLCVTELKGGLGLKISYT